ncbi:F-box domain containing protein, partial [Pseudohyphozyma bogoriensis]
MIAEVQIDPPTPYRVPPEIWLEILSRPELSYLDLKRVQRTRTFDAALFRSPPDGAVIPHDVLAVTPRRS